MAEGIEVEVEDGFAHIQFLDKTKAGPGLAALLELGGPELIDVDTRSNPRKTYIVPESIARDAGLLDDAQTLPEFPEGAPSDAWTVAQLRAYAAKASIELGSATKKADILMAALAVPAHSGITPPASAE